MPIRTREELKSYFRNGAVPTEKEFADLIDSIVLKSDAVQPIQLNAETFSKSSAQDILAMRARTGTYADTRVNPDTILADGKWHPIITNLNGLHAFEIVASASGPPKSGRHVVMHAFAMSAYGRSKTKIVHANAYFGFFWNRISLRWRHESTDNYSLEIKTGRNYGEGVKIKYNITQLLCE
jgi:hypothetical protein